MKSNALKLVYAALFGTAIVVSPGCGGTSGSDDRVLRQVLGLLQNLINQLINTLEQLTGVNLDGLQNTLDSLLGGNGDALNDLTDIINGGSINGLLNLGGNQNGLVNSLLNTLTGVVQGLTGQNLLGGGGGGGGGLLGGLSVANAADGVVQVNQASNSDLLLQQAQDLKSALDAGLPGGLTQLIDGTDALGITAINLSNEVVGTDDRAVAVRALLQGVGNLLRDQSQAYEAIGSLDGTAYANAELAFLDSIQTMANALPNQTGASLTLPIANTRASFESTRLPIARAVMNSLSQTQAGANGQFRDVMAGVITGNLRPFGGRAGLQRLLDTAAANASSQTPIGDLQAGVGNLGNLTGPLAGLNQGGLPAVNDILDPEGSLPNFGGLIPQIPGFTSASPGQVGNLISTVLTPGTDGILPINSLAGTGLLSGNVLSNLPQIGSVLGSLGGTLGSLSVTSYEVR